MRRLARALRRLFGEQPQPARAPLSRRELARHPLTASMIGETIHRLIDDDLVCPALMLAYFERALLAGDVDPMLVAMRFHQLHFPLTAVDVLAKGLSAAIEAEDSQVLYDTMDALDDEWMRMLEIVAQRQGKPS